MGRIGLDRFFLCAAARDQLAMPLFHQHLAVVGCVHRKRLKECIGLPQDGEYCLAGLDGAAQCLKVWRLNVRFRRNADVSDF